jgi:hypothetical protein
VPTRFGRWRRHLLRHPWGSAGSISLSSTSAMPDIVGNGAERVDGARELSMLTDTTMALLYKKARYVDMGANGGLPARKVFTRAAA